MSRLTRDLFRAARLSATASAIASCSPRRIINRGKNIALGRTLRPVWRRLWRPW